MSFYLEGLISSKKKKTFGNKLTNTTLTLVRYALKESHSNSASSSVAPASFDVTSPAKLVGRTRLGHLCAVALGSRPPPHSDSANWPGDEADSNLCFDLGSTYLHYL